MDGMSDSATGIPSWDWDFKDVYDDELGAARVDAVFAAAGKVRSDYRDPLAKFLVHKQLAQEGKAVFGRVRELAAVARVLRQRHQGERWDWRHGRPTEALPRAT